MDTVWFLVWQHLVHVFQLVQGVRLAAGGGAFPARAFYSGAR